MNRVSRWLPTRHPSDERLLEYCVSASSAAVPRRARAVQGHLERCPACDARYRDAAAFVESARQDAVSTADAAITAERLARQRDLVLRRLANLERPARILAFPASRRPMLDRTPRTRRWIASGAVAGLLIGLATGRFVDLYPHAPGPESRELATAPEIWSAPGSTTQLLGETAWLSPEDLLLVEIDDALSGPPIRELQAIDALTPHAREASFGHG